LVPRSISFLATTPPVELTVTSIHFWQVSVFLQEIDREAIRAIERIHFFIALVRIRGMVYPDAEIKVGYSLGMSKPQCDEWK
jgi:hypothetical protein